jgi:hypothetical protein
MMTCVGLEEKWGQKKGGNRLDDAQTSGYSVQSIAVIPSAS